MWTKLKAWFLRIKPEILAFLNPILQLATAELIAIAENAVAAGFAAGGNNSDKMAAALDYFRRKVKTTGRDFVESQARLLIELALQKAKG